MNSIINNKALLCFVFLISILSYNLMFSQTRTTVDQKTGKVYTIYTSIEDTKGVNPDSILIIELHNKGLKDFPKEVLNFRNIEVLDLCSFYMECVPQLLTKEQYQELEKYRKEQGTNEPFTGKYYNRNIIKNIPKEIVELKKLRVILLHGTKINRKNIRKVKKCFLTLE